MARTSARRAVCARAGRGRAVGALGPVDAEKPLRKTWRMLESGRGLSCEISPGVVVTCEGDDRAAPFPNSWRLKEKGLNGDPAGPLTLSSSPPREAWYSPGGVLVADARTHPTSLMRAAAASPTPRTRRSSRGPAMSTPDRDPKRARSSSETKLASPRAKTNVSRASRTSGSLRPSSCPERIAFLRSCCFAASFVAMVIRNLRGLHGPPRVASAEPNRDLGNQAEVSGRLYFIDFMPGCDGAFPGSLQDPGANLTRPAWQSSCKGRNWPTLSVCAGVAGRPRFQRGITPSEGAHDPRRFRSP